jgi:hypothetical protein
VADRQKKRAAGQLFLACGVITGKCSGVASLWIAAVQSRAQAGKLPVTRM